MQYDVVIFDLDGTVTDSAPLIIGSIKHTLQTMRKPSLSAAQLNRFIGPTLDRGFQQVAGFTQAETTEAIQIYREYYLPRMSMVPLFDGLGQLLAELHAAQMRLAIASAKLHPLVTQITQDLAIADYFEVIAGTEEAGVYRESDPSLPLRRSKAQVIKHVYQTLNAKQAVQSPVMIGDRKDDYLGARANQIPAIGVGWGAGSVDEFPGCPYLETISQLRDLLLKD